MIYLINVGLFINDAGKMHVKITSTCNMSTDMTDEGIYTTVRGVAIDF